MTTLPALPEAFEPTRATLHAYARAVSAIPRAHAEPHDRWWHAALTVGPSGLVTDPVPLPDGATARLTIDLERHDVQFNVSNGEFTAYGLQSGMTATELADSLIADASAMGLSGGYARDKFENDEPRVYDAGVAEAFFTVLSSVHDILDTHRATIGGNVGRINLWPHGFDVAFEWLGTRMVTTEEGGEPTGYPSQLNFGWYPEGEAYFYSNPWPFEREILLATELPDPARWHTDGWEGSMLRYDDVTGRDDAVELVLAYGRKVFEIASPTLMA